MNNTEKTLKNSAISVFAQVCTLLLQFVNRRIFVHYLNIEYLGYQSVFGNVFGLLSVAELGIGSIISYQLYKEVVDNNQVEIGKLMYLYKWLYRIVAGIVLLAGLVCYFFLPAFVKDANVGWDYLYLIYFLQLSGVIAGYFLSYKRIMFIATQQEYKCVKVDLYINICIQVLQLIFLALFRNYIVYLSIQLSTGIISNIIISVKTNNEFPYLRKSYNVSKKDIKSRNILGDIGNLLIHKISYVVYGGTDNIIISAFCGIRQVALFGNYMMVHTGVMQVLFYKLLNPVQATIGNIVYSKRSKEELWDQFQTLDVFSFFFATYIGIGFFVFYQPFIQLWMGRDYLLPFSFVIIHSILIYLGAVFEIVYKYRCVFGDYKQDRWYMVLSALLNVGISIAGAKHFGVTGVIFGTLIAFLPIAIGRIKFVIKGFFHKSISRYITKHAILLCIASGEAYIVWIITKALPITIIGFIIRIIPYIIVPLIINVMIFHKNKYYKAMVIHLRSMMSIIVSKARMIKRWKNRKH